MGAPNIQHAFQQRHLSSPAADWRNNVAWPKSVKGGEPEVTDLPVAENAPDPVPAAEPTLDVASADVAMAWLKADLMFYAEQLGVDPTGTKAEIVERLVVAGYLAR